MINIRGDVANAHASAGAVIRRLTFGSCYVYSPAGAGVVAERSRLLRALLKHSDGHFMDKYANRVRQLVADGVSLAGLFCTADVLIPIPGCAVPTVGRTSIAERLALALLSEGLGRGIWSGLRRAKAVRKSATAGPGLRPTVGIHYDSFAVEPVAIKSTPWTVAAVTPPYPHIMLVDDVVTKGRTLLAAAARVQEAFPNAQIRAFALMRTMGLISGIPRLVDPCIGKISWMDGDAHRFP